MALQKNKKEQQKVFDYIFEKIYEGERKRNIIGL